MQKIFEYIIFFILIFIAAGLYAFANFKESTTTGNKTPIYMMVFISITYAFFEYLIKIPTYYKYNKIFDPTQLQTIWLIMTTTTVILFQSFYLKKQIKTHTKITIFLVVAMLVIELMQK